MKKHEKNKCGQCRHFDDDAENFEDALPGILALSSGGGDTKGDQGFCLLHMQMVDPHLSCTDFRKKSLVK